MTNKIVAVQGNHPSKLNPITDTSVFLANEIQSKNYKIFYYDPKDLSVINSKVIASGFFIKFDYSKKKFFKILKKQKLDLTKCKFILIRQDPPFNLEYISAGINLGAIVTNTKGIATHITHIKGTIIKSVPAREKLSTKKKAKTATQSLPITADGTKSLFLAYLAITELQARPKAVIKPNKSP